MTYVNSITIYFCANIELRGNSPTVQGGVRVFGTQIQHISYLLSWLLAFVVSLHT